MDILSLQTIGLSSQQASAYALLIEHNSVKPSLLVDELGLTRTNAYKLLDKLVELKLAVKLEEGKKVVYAAANPIALAAMVAQHRAESVAREEAASQLLKDLLAKYHKHADKPEVSSFTGRAEVAQAYRTQLNLREDIHFIHTRADVPLMGFDVMHEIRTTPAHHGNKRSAIMTPPTDGSSVNWEQHERSKFEPTWIDPSLYNAPVEWSVTESSLLIVLYATEPHAILISDSVVAGSFLQLYRILESLLRTQPVHQSVIATRPATVDSGAP